MECRLLFAPTVEMAMKKRYIPKTGECQVLSDVEIPLTKEEIAVQKKETRLKKKKASEGAPSSSRPKKGVQQDVERKA